MNCTHRSFVCLSNHTNHIWCQECGAVCTNGDEWRHPRDMSGLRRFQAAVHQNAVNKGFWDEDSGEWTSPAAKIALMHSELSEALEAYRKGNDPDEHCPLHSSAEVEFADCIIRILDFCHHHDLDVVSAMKAKHYFNTKRPYKHGKQG